MLKILGATVQNVGVQRFFFPPALDVQNNFWYMKQPVSYSDSNLCASVD
jgi:hypothetical protein